MTNFASKISGAAMLALAALPIIALATPSSAATVKVSDLNLLTPQGVAEFSQRADAAGRKYCITERSVAGYASCRKGVKLELTEKMAAVRTAQLDKASPSLAAR